FFLVTLRPSPTSALFPYTTLFRSAHEFAELRLFAALRTGRVSLPGELADEAIRLIGGYGVAPQVRLGVGRGEPGLRQAAVNVLRDRKSTRLNSSHVKISYAVFCLK